MPIEHFRPKIIVSVATAVESSERETPLINEGHEIDSLLDGPEWPQC